MEQSAQTQANAALRLVAWSRVWSPLVPEETRVETWQAIALPGDWARHEAEFWQCFQIGVPAPPVPLLFHAALALDGERTREDWLRAIAHLGLEWQSARLPPDHLGPACEVLACALQASEQKLVALLCERYMLPWCQFADEHLAAAKSELCALPERMQQDLLSLLTP